MKKEGLRVLSLFDGMSCGQLAFFKEKIPVEAYYASEIEKHAITVTQFNFPNTIQVGDITKLSHKDIDNDEIDIIIGGSCCQNFSQIGNRQGLDGDKSRLFWDYLRLVKEIKPKYFLLENVNMAQKWKDIISKELWGIEPIAINSSLLSAQNRPRIYWVWKRNDKGGYDKVQITLPEDKGLVLKDILEEEVDEKFLCSERLINGFRWKKSVFRERFKLADIYGKGACLVAKHSGAVCTQNYIVCRKKWDKLITDYTPLENKGKLPTEWEYKDLISEGKCLRKLTPLEYEKLQTVPEDYTSPVSNSARFIMLWNAWTVDVIGHIFKQLFWKEK